MKLPAKTLDDTGGDSDANADQDQPTEELTALARLDPNPGTQLQADQGHADADHTDHQGRQWDMEYAVCYPPSAAFARICEIFTVAFARNGADPCIGRRVPELFRAAGLTDVEVEARAPMYPAGHTRRTVRIDLARSMRPHVLAMGLANEAELDKLDAAARAHLTTPAQW